MLKKYGQTLFIPHLLVVIVIALTVRATYEDINFNTRNMGSLIFTKTAVSTLDVPFDAESMLRDYVDNVTKLIVQSPISYIYATMPFTQNIPIYFPISCLTGVFDFEIPSGHDLINLELDNLYTPIFPTPIIQDLSTANLSDPSYLLNNIYAADAEIKLGVDTLSQWDFEELASRTLTIDTTVDGPEVLIFHTHNREVYIDEDWRNHEDGGVIAVGAALADELSRRYGLEVLHVTDGFFH